VLRRFLSSPLRSPYQSHATRELANNRVGAIGRTVGGDDDLEQPGRVVLRERVENLVANPLLFVVGRDDEGNDGRG
jgi:hypothetical protein